MNGPVMVLLHAMPFEAGTKIHLLLALSPYATSRTPEKVQTPCSLAQAVVEKLVSGPLTYETGPIELPPDETPRLELFPGLAQLPVALVPK